LLVVLICADQWTNTLCPLLAFDDIFQVAFLSQWGKLERSKQEI